MTVRDVMAELAVLGRKAGRLLKSVGGNPAAGEMEMVGKNGRSLYFQARPVGQDVVDVRWDAYENDGGKVFMSASSVSTDKPWWTRDVEVALKRVFVAKEAKMNKVAVAKELVAVAEMVSADADAEYKEKVRKVRSLLKDVEAGVKRHERSQSRDAGNWGYVGDMGRIAQELQDMVDSLRGA